MAEARQSCDDVRMTGPAALPVRGTLLTAVILMVRQRRELWRHLALPATLLAALHALTAELPPPPPPETWREVLATGVNVLMLLATLALTMAVATTGHRVTLGLPQPVPEASFWGLHFGRRELKFLLASFLIGATLVPLAAVLGALSTRQSVELGAVPSAWLMTAAMAIAGYFPARLSLALPAIALDQPRRLSWSWEVSRGQALRLLAITWWPVLLLERGLAAASATLGDPPPGAVAFALALLSQGVTVFGVTALSLCYQRLASREPGAEPKPSGALAS